MNVATTGGIDGAFTTWIVPKIKVSNQWRIIIIARAEALKHKEDI
jgi:hypothetical protein